MNTPVPADGRLTTYEESLLLKNILEDPDDSISQRLLQIHYQVLDSMNSSVPRQF